MKRNSIEEIRKLNDLSIAEVAEKAKLTPEKLKELEERNDLDNVDVLTMLKLSKALNTSIERLMGVRENAFVELLPEYVSLLEEIKMYERLEKWAQEDIYKDFETLEPKYIIQGEPPFFEEMMGLDKFILNREETAYTKLSHTSHKMKVNYESLCEWSANKQKCIYRKMDIEHCCLTDEEGCIFSADISPFANSNNFKCRMEADHILVEKEACEKAHNSCALITQIDDVISTCQKIKDAPMTGEFDIDKNAFNKGIER